jgi:hypothetical protein
MMTKSVGKKLLKSQPQWEVKTAIPYKGKYILVVKGGKAYVSSIPFKRITPIPEMTPFRTVADAKRSISGGK